MPPEPDFSKFKSVKEAYDIYKQAGESGRGHMNNLIDAMVQPYLEAEETGKPLPFPGIRRVPTLRETPVQYPAPADVDPDDADEFRKNAKIAVGLVFYNDINVIERALKSVKDFDLVICMDGVYDVNKGPALSTDGSRDVVKQFDNCLLVDMPYRQQPEVRNHYLDEAIWHGCQYLLVFEADEYVTGDMKAFRKNLPVHNKTGARDIVYNIPMHYVGQNHVVKSPRFFYKPELIRYGGTHSTYVIDGQAYLARNGDSENIATLKDIVVNHDEKPRTDRQQKLASDYQQALIKQERLEREFLRKGAKYL